ncbi:hypothetical protein GDO86_014999 [Hymenochirus boettgeri]|uniref:Uncharacterized protein n=1 Tax=Hymenochirus boettgeri TaxID=247094 RepID=A0A8T2JWE2_9PIPI|nr:hypothetical protein GDO86_014999 [Hymenochirus boettgeri]
MEVEDRFHPHCDFQCPRLFPNNLVFNAVGGNARWCGSLLTGQWNYISICNSFNQWSQVHECYAGSL